MQYFRVNNVGKKLCCTSPRLQNMDVVSDHCRAQAVNF